MKTEQIHSYTSDGEPLILAQPANELLHDKHQEILALRKERDELKRKNHCQSEQLNQYATENEAEKRRADELAAHVARIKEAGNLGAALEAVNQTPTQSLEALKLEQQAKGVEDFAQKLEDSSKDIPLGAEHRGRGSSTYNWQMYYKGVALNFAEQLRNQAKEQE